MIMTVAQSGEIYTILTIGDGLVAQIPALILSTATADYHYSIKYG